MAERVPVTKPTWIVLNGKARAPIMDLDGAPVDRFGLALAPIRSAFETAVQLLEAGRASLMLREPKEPYLVVVASIGIDEDILPAIRVPIGEQIAGLVVERGIGLFGSVGGETFLCVPIHTDSGVEGVLSVTDRRGGQPYTAEHLSLATSAATHISHLIQYGRHAVRDPVSGLPNRRAFEETLEREIALGRRTGSIFTLAFLDLDNFKSINDRLGHTRGDEVLRGLGDTLHHVLRPYDFAGRYGGDEFALLLSSTTESDGGISDRIADAVARLSAEMGIGISVSIGVARWPTDGADAPRLIAAADRRMYDHKRAKKQTGP
ncbi:MAG TPA: sensor domain-containing diguanylate cyclase [Chloroflexota bacterium]